MISKNDKKYFEKARSIASISDFKKTHVGCVAVYQGGIIGIGCNTNKTHPMQLKYNRYRRNKYHSESFIPKLHAEINCIRAIRHMDIDFSRVKLFVYRISNDNQPFGIARPCPSCMAAIKDLGIRNIYYTTNEGYAHEKIENMSTVQKGGVA